MFKFKGLGDVIAFFTKILGIKFIIKKLGINCGCEARQEKMNVKLPF